MELKELVIELEQNINYLESVLKMNIEKVKNILPIEDCLDHTKEIKNIINQLKKL